MDESGAIRVSDALANPVALGYAMEFLNGNQALAWKVREQTRPNFAYHYNKEFRRSMKIMN